jgi:hypothetical protein
MSSIHILSVHLGRSSPFLSNFQNNQFTQQLFSERPMPLPGKGLQPAKQLTITSAISFRWDSGQTRFNLITADNRETVLHMSIRAKENVLVLNTKDPNGNWGNEERHELKPLFDTPQLPYITVTATRNSYNISVPGNQEIVFNKRQGFMDPPMKIEYHYDDLSAFSDPCYLIVPSCKLSFCAPA